ncbi:hypothetical protein Bca52824_092901 [Brassica carinata]|uniref:F-box domain-containing protein n=1 Tax=Brassica carinata TaxID=52824 RepID=A0A8X7P627_BRACI|nr:hypothetical protein Bca52824_092901 [Brassica carinata]
MKAITNQNTCEGIPEEEILERLPEKSLFRFKSVSKQWKFMIESNYLANKRFARLPNPKLIVLRHETSTDESSRNVLLETISKDHHDHNKIFNCSYESQTNSDSEFYVDHHFGRIMGHCDGLICLYHFGYIFIINPAIGVLRTLSPEFLRNCKLPITVGFGRDNLTRTYKVVLMYYFRLDYETLLKTEVFNLKSGERKCICCPIPYSELNVAIASIFANGSLFWLTLRKLAALDLHTENFRYVLLPSWYTKYSKNVNLWCLKDRLCLSDVLQYPNVDVWSLQQEDPSVKWEKILSINILSMDCLDSNFWKLGLEACSLEPIGEKPYMGHLEQVPEDHFSTVLYRENLDSSV